MTNKEALEVILKSLGNLDVTHESSDEHKQEIIEKLEATIILGNILLKNTERSFYVEQEHVGVCKSCNEHIPITIWRDKQTDQITDIEVKYAGCPYCLQRLKWNGKLEVREDQDSYKPQLIALTVMPPIHTAVCGKCKKEIYNSKTNNVKKDVCEHCFKKVEW